METKSLYTILGARPDASSDQIESTYAEILHHLKDGSESNPGGDDRSYERGPDIDGNRVPF